MNLPQNSPWAPEGFFLEAKPAVSGEETKPWSYFSPLWSPRLFPRKKNKISITCGRVLYIVQRLFELV